MTAFFNRHSDKIMGIFSCIDRLIIQGTFPEICYPGAITNFFFMHGIIKKAQKSYKYYLTSLGRQITATSLKLKEMYVIPVLRGQLVIS